jgi:SAM-dependent methyltransferase
MEHSQTTGATAPLSTLAHSEEWFGASRDYWWNADFLDLMASRWRLADHQSLLDVGCGQCHWSRLLVPRMAARARVTALDRDVKWAAGDPSISKAFAAFGASVEFHKGDAQALPFGDDSFDIVTCQTVLMHLADPLAALLEMRRVVRPGGIVICAEPCNLAQTALSNATTTDLSIDDLCDAFRYALLCERGKRASGEGGLSLGDRLPRLFQLAGLSGIQSYLSDKASPILPPYQGHETCVNLADLMAAHEDARVALWENQVDGWIAALNDDEARAFVAGIHAKRREAQRKLQGLVETQSYWDSGATLTYLISASK